MARLARLVVFCLPHHVTQGGKGRARAFFEGADYVLYRGLLAQACAGAGVQVWAWCLMPNHVYLILVPADEDGLRRALSRTHRGCAGLIHARRKRTGHFWQSWFGSVVLDEAHLAAAVRYVPLNPVRACLVARAQEWRWSSVRAHLYGRDDGLTRPGPALDRFSPFRDFLEEPADPAAVARLRAAESIGRPLGDRQFLSGSNDSRREGCSPRNAARNRAPMSGGTGGRFTAVSPEPQCHRNPNSTGILPRPLPRHRPAPISRGRRVLPVASNNLPALGLGAPAWSGPAPDPLAQPELYDGILWRRVLGYFVDLALIAAISVAAWAVLMLAGVLSLGLLMPLVPLALALIPVAFHTLLIGGPSSATIGMQIFDTEVRSWTGERPGYWQAFLMTVLFYTSVGITGLLILAVVFFNARRRTFHDLLSGTVVVRARPLAAGLVADAAGLRS